MSTEHCLLPGGIVCLFRDGCYIQFLWCVDYISPLYWIGCSCVFIKSILNNFPHLLEQVRNVCMLLKFATKFRYNIMLMKAHGWKWMVFVFWSIQITLCNPLLCVSIVHSLALKGYLNKILRNSLKWKLMKSSNELGIWPIQSLWSFNS